MRSLQARLFAALAGAILITGFAAGAFSFYWAFEEAIELQDSVLLQVGALAVRTKGPITLARDGDVDPQARVTIEEMGARPQTGGTPALPALPLDLDDGLHTLPRGDQGWRALVRTRPDGSRVAIGQPTSSRDEIAHDSAIRTIAPLAVLFPVLMLLVGLIVRSSLQSVSQLAHRLDAEQAGHLQELPLSGMPEELVPFVRSINRLLERIALMFDHQGRFIAAAAHELRTPITALSLQAENLERAGLTADAAERLAVLRNGIARIAHLLEQLLAASKYESQRAAPTPLTPFAPIAKDVVADHLRRAQERGIDLGFERIEEVSVRAEAMSLSVLVRNLLDNALRHTPDGGCVDLDLVRDGSRIRLRIEDTGPGIPAADLDRVFEPFVRGDPSDGEGSGLGLSIVRSIVHLADGAIVIENRRPPDRPGLRVTVTFPAPSD